MHQTLSSLIASRQAVAGIIGLGYVGLPLARQVVQAGFRTVGFDIDAAKVEALKRGESYISHLDFSELQAYCGDGRFEPTTDFDRLAEVDFCCICVPTPLNRYREPDLSFVEATGRDIARRLRPGQLIILESTSYPGTTEEALLPLLASPQMQVGKDFFVGYSPEREDPGVQQFSFSNIPKVVSGITPGCRELTAAFYRTIVEKVVEVSNPRTAEMAKLLENIYRSVNIALVNELKMLATDMDIDIWEVIAAAATKPFGFMPFYPGPGLGGHCIPVDPFYLSWKAKEFGHWTHFIELAGEVNAQMPEWVVGRLAAALNEECKSLKGSRILVLGVAYKRDVNDMRESPSITIIEMLQARGAEVEYSDPLVPRFPSLRKSSLHLESQPLTAERLASADAVLLLTDHTGYDYAHIAEHSRLIVDTRNAFAGVMGKARVVKG